NRQTVDDEAERGGDGLAGGMLGELIMKAPTKITWNDILTEVRNLDEPTVLATLKFADLDYTDGQITLYFSKAFHRKKADAAKSRSILSAAFEKLYGVKPEIIVSGLAVRENSDMARILDIMGGGEVVRDGKA
ncbi:hypothetical protein FWC31_00580, partial [Candidatus Saccharibacteria bacterium]|nr:hypothetical protein [Candidatus Saccharibacteria bacterium]